MTDFKRAEVEIGLEFEHNGFNERNNFSEGSSKPRRDTHVF